MVAFKDVESFSQWWDGTGPYAGKGANMSERKQIATQTSLKEGVAKKSWGEIFKTDQEALFKAMQALTG
ncbi:MAG: hypothetical protein AAB443_01325 [Patescibacteria group bacterium]